MGRKLRYDFFNRPTLKVAKELLGKFLVRRLPPTADSRGPNRSRTAADKTLIGVITEVEAYIGPNDRASHASRGKTERTKVMFGKPGYWYVYMIYGMHYCLNIVTERENYPAAVLIRSVVLGNGVSKLETPFPSRQINGPGRVCKFFRIDRGFNNKPARRLAGLWTEDRGVKINPRRIRRGKRIGVEYAGKWKEKPWRFYIENKIPARRG